MYLLKVRFDKIYETPAGPLTAHGHKMSITKKDREIKFDNAISKKKLKEIIVEHYKKHNGKVEFFGEIKYYEFYEDGILLYKLDTCGNIVANQKLVKLLLNFRCKNDKYIEEDLSYIYQFGERYLELYDTIFQSVNKNDPFGIAFVSQDEYKPEIREIVTKTIGKKLTKKKIFFIVKETFDKWFDKVDDNSKYEAVAKDIYQFYEEKIKLDEWFAEG